MIVYIVLAVILGLWGLALWSRGFFSTRTSSLEKRVYAVRALSWLASVVIIAWPLEIYRRSIGDIAYVAIAVVVLALFFGLGAVATRRMIRHDRQWQ